MSNAQDNAAHTCSYSCDRPECIKAQRDELAAAAAQEAVAHLPRRSIDWLHGLHSANDATRKADAYNRPVPDEQTIPVYAAPVTAAPVTVTRDADGEIVMVKQGDTIIASTCHAGGKATAAPGIDHRSLIEKWRNSGNPDYGDCADDLEALIDASPKGELESWKRGTKACAEVLGQVTRQMQDSPKDGSEAQDAARYRFLREVAHPDSDDGIAVTIQKQDSWGNWRDMHLHGPELDAATDAAMQAQAGDAEVQP